MTSPTIGVDTETEAGHIWCVGVANDEYRHATKDWWPLVERFQTENITPIFHNAKWDVAEFRREGAKWIRWEDTILKAHMLGFHPLGLKALTPIFTGVQLQEYGTVVGHGKKAVPMDSIAPRVLDYCSLDAWAAYQCNKRFTLPPAWQTLYEDEKHITRILMDMEAGGLPLDQGKLRHGRQVVLRRMAELERTLADCGIEELTKTEAIARRFWKGKPKKVTTKSGRLSTKAAVMREHAGPDDKWLAAFIEWKQLSHFEGTYLAAWKGQESLHPSLNQTGAMTWRFSCSDPNLQNIPKSNLVSLYNLFVAPEGFTFVSLDYSQIELRVLANLTRDPAMLEAYLSGRDLHRETQDNLERMGLFERHNITHPDKKRVFAKTINFGIAYGITAHGLAPRLNLPEAACQPFIDGFYEAYPTVRPWQQHQIATGEERGYVETFTGRPLYVPCVLAERGVLRIRGENQCKNFPVQGGAAEIVKDGMRRAPQYLRMQVHDELLYLVPKNEAPDYAQHLKETLVDYRHDVPYTVDVKVGDSWGEIKALADLWVDDLNNDDEEGVQ